MAGFTQEWRVVSTAQVVASGKCMGIRRGQTCVAQFVIFFVSNPRTASRMGEGIGKVGLRECVRWRRGFDGLIMYFLSSIA